jgi:hypothetical protein
MLSEIMSRFFCRKIKKYGTPWPISGNYPDFHSMAFINFDSAFLHDLRVNQLLNNIKLFLIIFSFHIDSVWPILIAWQRQTQ